MSDHPYRFLGSIPEKRESFDCHAGIGRQANLKNLFQTKF